MHKQRMLHEVYGSFTDLPSFRAETGLTEDDIKNEDALKVISEDAQEQIRLKELEKKKLEDKLRDESLRAHEAAQKAKIAEQELALERYKPKTTFITDLSRDGYLSPNDLQKYLEKERIKKELKQELEEERKLKALHRRAFAKSSVKRQSRSKSKSKSHSKKPKPKSRSKSRSKHK